MTRVQRLLLSIGVMLLVPVDAWVVIEALQSHPSEAVNGLQVAVAVAVQAVAIVFFVGYIAYLGQAKPVDTKPNVILDALRLRLVPLLIAGLLAALSVTLLEQALKCGSHPFPTVRGAPLCGKA